MLDRITDLFRRNKATKTSPGDNPVAKKQVIDAKPAAPAPDPQAEELRAQRIAEATRQLEGTLASTDALRIARDDLPAELRLRALARVEDSTALRDIALNDKVAKVRLAAAEKLTAHDDLEALRRDSSDKAVQRHVREALKERREADKAAQETHARINHVLNSLAQHASRAFEPLYDAKLETLEAAWKPLAAHASAAEQERFAELSALARDTVQRHAAEISARQQAIAAKQELIAACNELETVVAQLRREDLSAQLSAVTALHVTQETRWQEAASLTPVDAPLEQRFRSARQIIDAWLSAAAELPRIAHEASALLNAMTANTEPDSDTLDDWHHTLDTLQSRCHWPAGLLQPALLDELAAARKQVKQLEKARQLDRQEQLLQLRKRRHALKRMIDEGQLRAATRTMTWLRKRIAELPAGDAAAETTALEPVAEALQRLHDWYEFASVPKKTELCERIEALTAELQNDGDPGAAISERAEHVRELREQWNLLCAADPEADPELRARFDRAAGMAYAPCAAFYAELHRRQDENLARRATLCDELAAYCAALDGATADWKAVEKHERETRAAWKSIEPVRWPDARATQERFSQLIGTLRERLDTVRSSNATQRDELIAQAAGLQTLESVDAAINAAKRLQEQWKHVGHTDPRDDRRQWLAFRAALDAVFARRDAARNAEREAREAAHAEQLRLQEEAARQKAEEQQKRAARDAQLRDARQREISLARALGLLESRWAVGETVDAGELAAQLDSLPKSAVLAALKTRIERMQRDEKPAATELTGNDEKLAVLTLDLEIVYELPSPPALANVRMQRKVERLNSALRGGQREKDDPKVALFNAWLALGPVSAGVRAELDERFAPLAARS